MDDFTKTITTLFTAEDFAEYFKLKAKAEYVNSIKESEKGVVYILKNEKGYYKIGYTTRPIKERITTFKISNPDIELVKVIQAENARLKEKQLHEQFSHKRITGEWFNLNKNELKKLYKILQIY